MSLTKITDATDEPVSTIDAKFHLRETWADAGNDAYIDGLVKVARQTAEGRLGRTLLETTWLLTQDTFGCFIVLERPPIIAVDWVKYVDANGTLQTLDPAQYQVSTAREPGRIAPAYGKVWPQTRWQMDAVQVQYTAGYADVDAIPVNIIHWIKLALTELYTNRSRSSERPSLPNNFADELLLGAGDTVWSV